jgi:hypothetical protein
MSYKGLQNGQADGVRAINYGFRLADFFAIKRGLATDHNGFFIMTRAKFCCSCGGSASTKFGRNLWESGDGGKRGRNVKGNPCPCSGIPMD